MAKENSDKNQGKRSYKHHYKSVAALIVFHAIIFTVLIVVAGPARIWIVGVLSVVITAYLLYNTFRGSKKTKEKDKNDQTPL